MKEIKIFVILLAEKKNIARVKLDHEDFFRAGNLIFSSKKSLNT